MTEATAAEIAPDTPAAGTAGTADYDYLRVRITATLRTESPLHCGDGGDMPAAAWLGTAHIGGEGHINTVCHGAEGAYIPASTLRGNLRGRCPEPARTFLFGSARGEGAAGLVRVYDAPVAAAGPPEGDRYWNSTRGSTIRNGVSLDSLSGTAAEGKLFQFEILPEGSVASLRIDADHISRDDLAMLTGLVESWQNSPTMALGRGLSRGWGRVTLADTPSVLVVTDDMLADWLRDGAIEPPAPQPLADPPAPAAPARAQVQRLELRLLPTSPLLVNQPGRIKPRPAQHAEGQEEPPPSLEFSRAADGTAIIPGSSLRGALRARAARIFATLVVDSGAAPPAQQLAEMVGPTIDDLFGTERRRSPIWISEARAVNELPEPHHQRFNGVDRFTGGVAKGALYSARAVACERFDAQIDLDLRRCPCGNWWKGLLLFLARDLIEGDCSLGWGKSRGFGTVTGAFAEPQGKDIANFEPMLDGLRALFGADAPRQWVQALQDEAARVRREALGTEQP